MPSLIGKASKTLRNAAPPVPMGSRTGAWAPGLMLGDADDLAYMGAYTSNGTVNSNVSLLASSSAKPEWRLYRSPVRDGRVRYTTNDGGSDQRTEVVQHQALNVLATPATITTGRGQELVIWSRFQLFEVSGIWLETTGKSHWVVERDERANIPLGLWPVRPDRMQAVPDADKYLVGWVYTGPDGRTKIPLEPDEVIFNRYPDPMDSYGGCGPIRSVLVDIDSARYAAEWNRQYFVNSAEPGGVIEVDHEVDDDEWHDLMERWREGHRGVARAHRIAVLEAGQKWLPNQHSLKDMDFIALKNVSRDIIRESLGMHKVMTGVTDDVNRANAQTGEEVFANWKIVPRLDRWKDVLNYQFLPLFGSAGQGVEFDYIYPLPANREQDNAELLAKGQAALWLVQAGYDPEQVLETVGLPAMDATAPPAPAPDAGDPDTSGTAGGDGDPTAQNRAREVLAKQDAAAKVIEQLAPDYPPHAIAWVYHADWSGPVKVPLEHVDPDMSWMGPADPDHVADFVKLLQAGKKLKPVILVKTPKGTKLRLADGHHRYLACAEMKVPVRAFVATTAAEHGDWETMHEYQRDDGDGARGGAKALARQLAMWNLAGSRR